MVFVLSISVGFINAEVIVPGNNLTEKLTWLQRSADSHNTYIVEVNANENIEPHTLEYRGAINISIILRGDAENRIIRLRSHGSMFTVKKDVTLILYNNITLQGHNGNNGSMIYIDGGTFRMNEGTTITGNTGGINKRGYGGQGGGVYVQTGTFEMNGGTISNNSVLWSGGGVDASDGSSTMNGGTISGNIASFGGGVYVNNGSFTIRGGMIFSNIAREMGGGVFSFIGGTFIKIGGVITGYNSDQVNGNVVRDDAGNIIGRRGHAVFVNENRRKETTAGEEQNLSSRDTGRWD